MLKQWPKSTNPTTRGGPIKVRPQCLTSAPGKWHCNVRFHCSTARPMIQLRSFCLVHQWQAVSCKRTERPLALLLPPPNTPSTLRFLQRQEASSRRGLPPAAGIEPQTSSRPCAISGAAVRRRLEACSLQSSGSPPTSHLALTSLLFAAGCSGGPTCRGGRTGLAASRCWGEQGICRASGPGLRDPGNGICGAIPQGLSGCNDKLV